MKLFIKNMVCDRCKMVVRSVFEQQGLSITALDLGWVELPEALEAEQKNQLLAGLQDLGFDLIDDKKVRITEQIKNEIIHLVHYENASLQTNFSERLSNALCHDYSYLSTLFHEQEGLTIEKYLIAQKIERVKELLAYGELSLSEIAFQMNYSSVAYLSNQFKKNTGYTPSQFKQLKVAQRISLDRL